MSKKGRFVQPGFRPGGMGRTGGGGGGGGGGDMLAQLQKLQDEMAKTQDKLAEETVEVTAGGGSIKAVMNGKQKLVSLTIAPEAVDPEDVEMLQDLILAVVNEAVERSQTMASERMNSMTSGLGLPGL